MFQSDPELVHYLCYLNQLGKLQRGRLKILLVLANDYGHDNDLHVKPNVITNCSYAISISAGHNSDQNSFNSSLLRSGRRSMRKNSSIIER